MPTLINISPELIKVYQDEVLQTSSPATAKRKNISLNKFFNWAQSAGHITSNPLKTPPHFVHSTPLRISRGKKLLKTIAISGMTFGMAIFVFAFVWKVRSPIQFIRDLANNNIPESKIQAVPGKTPQPTPTPTSISAIPTEIPSVIPTPSADNPAIGGANVLIEGETVTVKTTDGGDGNIEINPDGSGIAHFLFEGTGENFLNAQAPNLTSGSLYYGIVANNATGYDLLRLQSGSKPITRLSVDALGNTFIGGSAAIAGNFTITQSPGTFASILKKGSALSDVLSLTLDERNYANSSYSTLVLNRYNGAKEALAFLVDEGNARFDGQIQLGQFSTNPNSIGQGSIIFNTTDTTLRVWNGSSWVVVAGSGTDADTLDTLDSTQFLRSDMSDSFTSGTLTLDSGTTLDINGDLSIADTNIAFDGASTAFTATGILTLDSGSGSVSLATGDDLNLTAATDLIFGGTTSLGETTAANDSGAYLVGTFDEFDNSASSTVQGVLNDLDIALATGGSGAMWTLGSGVIYPTSATSDFALGGSALAASMFGLDESAGNFYFGYDNSANPTLNFEATDADAGEFGFNTNDSFYFSNANVGIGNTAPVGKLDVSGAVVGKVLAIFNETGDQALFTASASGTPKFTIDHDGEVGIGVTAPSYQLELSSDSAAKPTTNTWTIASDERIKNIVGAFDKGLTEILEVNPIVYTYREDNALGIVDPGEHVGIIAQVVQAIFPEAITTDDKGYLHFNSDALSWASINAIKELNSKIEALSQLITNNIRDGVVEIDKLIAKNIQTNLISPIPGEDLVVELVQNSKFKIQDENKNEVAGIDSGGNATFSGELRAREIHSENLDEIEALLVQVQLDQSILLAATASATPSELIASNLYITNHAAISSLLVNETLTSENIDSLSGPLKIQSLAVAPIELMAGLVKIDTLGNVQIAGSLNVAGKITAPEADFEKLSIENLVIATSSTSGVNTPEVLPGDITTNSIVGKGIIPAGVDAITITNPKVGSYTLIYVTPTSSTENRVLYVKAKDTGWFSVGFTEPLETDVIFNWWVVKTK